MLFVIKLYGIEFDTLEADTIEAAQLMLEMRCTDVYAPHNASDFEICPA